jgi:hypothetical protein
MGHAKDARRDSPSNDAQESPVFLRFFCMRFTRATASLGITRQNIKNYAIRIDPADHPEIWRDQKDFLQVPPGAVPGGRARQTS